MQKITPTLTLGLIHPPVDDLPKRLQTISNQNDIELEFILAHDRLGDDFGISGINETKPLRFLRCDRSMGIPSTRNRIIKESDAPFILFLDQDWQLLPEALPKMMAALETNEKFGMARCQYFTVPTENHITRDHFRGLAGIPEDQIDPKINIRRQLLSRGSLNSWCAMYKRQAFESAGTFNTALTDGIDLEMALRILDHHEMAVVPKILCFRKDPSADSQLSTLRQRWRICRAAEKQHQIKFMRQKIYRINRLSLRRLLEMSDLARRWESIIMLPTLPGKFIARQRQRIHTVLIPFLYQQLSTKFTWWPLGSLKKGSKPGASQNTKLAYYTWHFPCLSQTFIQREIGALKKSGNSFQIFADVCLTPEILDENARRLISETDYILPIDRKRLAAFKRTFLRRHPLRYINLFMYIVTHSYGHFKSYRSDKEVFHKAIYLAGGLQEKGITHVHAPWADISAFLVLIASRLLGITYSLQGRAHDIHRKSFLHAIPEKFGNAKFAITNTRYNVAHLRSSFKVNLNGNLHQIYNGVDLSQFSPQPRIREANAPTRIICVARLIEQKGLLDLLEACGRLREQHINFSCDIIGGPEEPLYLNYHLELKKRLRRLGLEKQVKFLGEMPFQSILAHYQKADIFALPCVIAEDGSRDIIPNAVIEAMAMKLPVVSTTATGVPEMVEDRVCGILVPPADVDRLTEAILELIDDENLRREYGENGRMRVEDRFNINKNAERFQHLFLEENTQSTS